jgi:hypothetical protein
MAKMRDLPSRLKRAVADTTVVDLRRRVGVLEEEVQECRELNLRVAELVDLVGELLLPVAQRDDQRVRELIARYQDAL